MRKSNEETLRGRDKWVHADFWIFNLQDEKIHACYPTMRRYRCIGKLRPCDTSLTKERLQGPTTYQNNFHYALNNSLSCQKAHHCGQTDI